MVNKEKVIDEVIPVEKKSRRGRKKKSVLATEISQISPELLEKIKNIQAQENKTPRELELEKRVRAIKNASCGLVPDTEGWVIRKTSISKSNYSSNTFYIRIKVENESFYFESYYRAGKKISNYSLIGFNKDLRIKLSNNFKTKYSLINLGFFPSEDLEITRRMVIERFNKIYGNFNKITLV